MGLTYDALFPSRFLKGGEFDGKPVTLTIANVYLDSIEQDNGAEKPQAVLAFKETKRELALNKTNGQCLLAMWGQDTSNWVDHKLTLYPEPDTSGLSDSGYAIRVKGSPDIDKTITATIKLPRKRPVQRKLEKTKAGKDKAFDDDAPVDTATGEIKSEFVAAMEADDDWKQEER